MMSARPMTEGERARALRAAERIIDPNLSSDRFGYFADAVLVADALLSTSSAVRGMREALEAAAAQFRFYEREHQAKANAVHAVSGPRRDEYEKRAAKAKTNKDFADMCFAALSLEGEDKRARSPSALSASISHGNKAHDQ